MNTPRLLALLPTLAEVPCWSVRLCGWPQRRAGFTRQVDRGRTPLRRLVLIGFGAALLSSWGSNARSVTTTREAAVREGELNRRTLECQAPAACGDGLCDATGDELTACPADCTTRLCESGGACFSIGTCGNLICDVGESRYTCSIDCGELPGCGNGVCESTRGERYATCPTDCPNPGRPGCGNGLCEPEENDEQSRHACSSDCPTPDTYTANLYDPGSDYCGPTTPNDDNPFFQDRVPVRVTVVTVDRPFTDLGCQVPSGPDLVPRRNPQPECNGDITYFTPLGATGEHIQSCTCNRTVGTPPQTVRVTYRASVDGVVINFRPFLKVRTSTLATKRDPDLNRHNRDYFTKSGRRYVTFYDGLRIEDSQRSRRVTSEKVGSTWEDRRDPDPQKVYLSRAKTLVETFDISGIRPALNYRDWMDLEYFYDGDHHPFSPWMTHEISSTKNHDLGEPLADAWRKRRIRANLFWDDRSKEFWGPIEDLVASSWSLHPDPPPNPDDAKPTLRRPDRFDLLWRVSLPSGLLFRDELSPTHLHEDPDLLYLRTLISPLVRRYLFHFFAVVDLQEQIAALIREHGPNPPGIEGLRAGLNSATAQRDAALAQIKTVVSFMRKLAATYHAKDLDSAYYWNNKLWEDVPGWVDDSWDYISRTYYPRP